MLQEEYKKLLYNSKNGKVRISKVAARCSSIDLAYKQAITRSIADMLEYQFNTDYLKDYLSLHKSFAKNFNMQGNGTIEDPFTISTKFADGFFYNARSLFPDKNYPNFVKPRNCHTNSYKFAKMFIGNCEVLFGVCHTSHSFLHSVVKINDVILDFNYNLVMSEETYYRFFNFEILNSVKNSDIIENHNLLVNEVKNNNLFITDGEVNACFYELVETIKNNNSTNVLN